MDATGASRVQPPIRQMASPTFLAELTQHIENRVVEATGNPRAAMDQVNTHLADFPNPHAAVFVEGPAKTVNPGLKRVTVIYNSIRTRLSQLAGTFTARSRKIFRIEEAGLTSIFSKKTPIAGSLTRAIHASKGPRSEKNIALVAKEQRLLQTLEPLKEVENLYQRGLIGRDERKTLAAQLQGKAPTESLSVLTHWLEEHGGKADPRLKVQDHPATTLLAHLNAFQENMPLLNRLHNDLESGLIPKKWGTELTTLFENAKEPQKVSEYEMVRYLCKDFIAQAKAEGILPTEVIDRIAAAETYTQACQIAQQAYEAYAAEHGVPPPTARSLPGLQLQAWQQAVLDQRMRSFETPLKAFIVILDTLH